MQITINNCNNIDSGSVEIKEGTLNIKHAINGTGKSTVARSILAAVQDKTSGKELAKLLPYKLAGQAGVHCTPSSQLCQSGLRGEPAALSGVAGEEATRAGSGDATTSLGIA